MKDFWKKEIEKKGKLCFLAPMDGYGDSAYRQAMKKIARDIYCISEFYSADGLVYSKFLADCVLPHQKIEKPLIVQIFGKDPENFMKAAKIIERYDIKGIDVNMGCPSKKVVRSGHGSSLLINQNLAFRIIDSLNKVSKLPISVKTRLSFDGNQNLINFAKGLENSGASLLTIHGRTAKQGYTGTACFEDIYELKNHLSIPVVCNGDIKNFDDGMEKIKNLDGFMIGRGSFGNPWCFLNKIENEKIRNYWKDGQYNPTLKEILETMEFHATKLVETKGERKGSLEIRKHLVQYLKNFSGVKAYRKRLVSVGTLCDSISVINDIRKDFKCKLEKRPGFGELLE